MAKLWEWVLAGTGYFLTGYSLSEGLWIHAIVFAAFSLIVTYLNLEPVLVRNGLVRRSILNGILP